MKKLFTLLAASLAFAGSIFAEAPTFDNPKAYVIDATKIPGKMKDSVKVRNVSTAANFNIEIQVYDEAAGKWIFFGEGYLKGLGDTDTIDSISSKSIKLKNYNYIAVIPASDNSFKYSASKANNDLHIWFYDNKNSDESHFAVFDVSTIGKFSDSLKIEGGKSLSSAASFKIYAYNDENEEKKAVTIAILKGAGDTDSYSKASNGVPFKSFRYFKIISREEKDYKYSARCESNDLIITVKE